jgi:hypothetical protein
MHVPHSCSDCQQYSLQLLWQIIYEELAAVVACETMWQNVRASKMITNNLCRHISAKLLLVSRMDYIMRILLCPLVLVVNINNAVATERGSSVKKLSTLRLTKRRQNNY